MTWGQGRGRGWAKRRRVVFVRDNYTCQLCRKVTNRPECDHIKPLVAGGSDELSNLQTLCPPCHQAKTAADRCGRPVQIKGCNANGAPFGREGW